MEKQFHFKRQAPKLVGLRLFSSHPWGDLCPLKNPCEVQVCSAAAPGGPCWSPFGARGALPTEGDHFQLFFLLGYKGWLHLVHFNEQPLFAQVQAGGLCAELQPNERGKKAPLKWRGRTRRIQ